MPGAAPTEEPDLVARAAAGDRAALGELWRVANPGLVRYLAARGARHPEDLAAQVWVEIVRRLAAFRRGFDGGQDEFRRWLYTTARRRLIDEYRRSGPASSPIDTETAPARPSADDAVVGRSWAVDVVRRLPPEQADVVLLRAVAGLSVADVALVLGKSEGAVRVLAHRGLARLRDELGAAAADGRAEREGA